jgi:hypothetical protein
VKEDGELESVRAQLLAGGQVDHASANAASKEDFIGVTL